MSDEDNKDFVLEAIQVWRTENLLAYVEQDLDTRIKKDRAVKLSVLATGLSAFLHEPINLFLKGESGIGKSYNVTETLKYFPEEDVWFLGGMSRKSLVHSHGVLLNKNGEEIDVDYRPTKPNKKDFDSEEDYKKAVQDCQEQFKDRREEMRDSYTLVDLGHKILVFLESPDYETFQMLRPILSHDKEEITFIFVDKTGKGQLQTRKVVLRGWPATVYLTTDVKYVEELATRSFTATPECSGEKILEANVLTNFKVSLPWRYKDEAGSFKIISSLINKLHNQTLDSSLDVIVPFLNLYELFPKEITRDMRDFQHFTQFLKTVTLLHYFQRPYMKMNDSKLLVATLADVEKALAIYEEIFETTRTGTERRILDFYHDIVKTEESWYLKELTSKYNEKARKKLSEDSVRKMLQRLDDIGYVNTEKNEEGDKRLNLYKPLMKGEEKAENPRKNSFQQDSKPKLEKGFQTWKETIGITTGFYIYKNNSEKTWGENEITLTELESAVITPVKNLTDEKYSSIVNPNKIPIVVTEQSTPKTEKNLETSGKQVSQQDSTDSHAEDRRDT